MKSRRVRPARIFEPLEQRAMLSAQIVPSYVPSWNSTGHAIQSPEAQIASQQARHVVSLPRRSSLAMFSPAALPAALGLLVAPSASLVSATASQVNLSATPASGGSGTYTYQWYRGPNAGFVPSSATVLPGATSLTLSDSAGLAGDVPYFYVLAASDGVSTVYSNQIIGALSIPTQPINLPYESGPVLVGYLGSSTWAINQGSGQVPSLIDGDIRAAYPAATFTTYDGAISGTTTSSFLPGQPFNSALKSTFMNFTGYKVLRMMIGSNDASSRNSLSTWLANMQAIIQDALTWPVDLIVLEEIGVRLDGGNVTLELIREYNAARSSLLGPKVVLGTACTYENQALNLSTLSSDQVHQTNAGQINLASNQATEVTGLFTPPTTINVAGDNVSYVVSEDPAHSLLQIAPGAAPAASGGPSSGGGPTYDYPLSSAPLLTINLLGANDSITFNFANGPAVPAGGIVINGLSSGHARLYVIGQTPGQTFTMTDNQIIPLSGGNISFQNVSELHLSSGTFNYTGDLSAFNLLDIGQQASFIWN
jgi:hypothetical protein